MMQSRVRHSRGSGSFSARRRWDFFAEDDAKTDTTVVHQNVCPLVAVESVGTAVDACRRKKRLSLVGIDAAVAGGGSGMFDVDLLSCSSCCRQVL